MFQITRHLMSLLFFQCFVLMCFFGNAQDVDLEGIKDKDPIKINGSVNASTRVYNAQGIENRQDPFLWNLQGTVNISLYGISTPLSFMFTSQDSEFRQPYNRFSIAPKYKWVKAHLGYSNMTFSEFTLGGHTFMGAGVEVTPAHLRFAMNYGRFATAVPQDQAINQRFEPSFSRWGGGGLIGYGSEDNHLDFIFFSAKDDPNSWDSIPTFATIVPAENMVLGVSGRLSVIKNLVLEGEIAQSIYTYDSRDITTNEETLFSPLGFQTKSSSQDRNAYKAKATYNLKGHRIGASFKQVDPNYQTMGAYFFNNDIRNITANYTGGFFNKRVHLVLTGGYQHNNLDGLNATESSRQIGSANITYSKSPLTLGVSYSNYSSDLRYVLNDALDSLNAVIVTQSIGFNGAYSMKPNKNRTEVISLVVNFQDVSDDFTLESRGTESKLSTVTGSYAFKYPKIRFQMVWSANYTNMVSEFDEIVRIGLGGKFKKKLLKEHLDLSLGINYYNSSTNNTINSMLQAGYRFKKRHQVSIGASLISRFYRPNSETTKTSYSETIGSLAYSYTF